MKARKSAHRPELWLCWVVALAALAVPFLFMAFPEPRPSDLDLMRLGAWGGPASC